MYLPLAIRTYIGVKQYCQAELHIVFDTFSYSIKLKQVFQYISYKVQHIDIFIALIYIAS